MSKKPLMFQENFDRSELIINKAKKEFNTADHYPLSRPLLTQFLNIDTRFRKDLYTSESSNFTFTLPNPIKNVVSMKLSAFEIPTSFYTISESLGNNFLNVGCTYQYKDENKMISNITVIVNDGNYTVIDLLSVINGKLRLLNDDDSLVHTAKDDEASIFNNVQLKLDITPSGSGSGKITLETSDHVDFAHSEDIELLQLNFNLNIDGINDSISIISKIGWNLGFIKPNYLGKKEYISDTLPDITSIRYVYICVNDFNNSVNNNFVGAFDNWVSNNNILARVPINNGFFSLLMENDLSQNTEQRRYFGPVDIKRLNVQLLDDHGRILNMNKANYSICLGFKISYD
jgi:hypothetical protein